MSARAYTADDLFAALSATDDAGVSLSRAVTAGEGGRLADQRALIEQATASFAKALSLLKPAGPHETQEIAA